MECSGVNSIGNRWSPYASIASYAGSQLFRDMDGGSVSNFSDKFKLGVVLCPINLSIDWRLHTFVVLISIF